LAKQLKSGSDSLVRSDAAMKLGKTKDTNAIAPLCECLGNKSEEELVRVSCSAALGKISDAKSKACLVKFDSDANAKVREQTKTSLLALGVVGCPSPPANATAKYLVGVSTTNKTSRSLIDIRYHLEHTLGCKLSAFGRFRVMFGDDTDQAKLGAIVKSESLDGYFLLVDAKSLKYEGGSLKLAVSMTIMTYDRKLIGGIEKSLEMPGVSSPSKSDEDDLLSLAGEKLAMEFASTKP
jgi:hypothetical protein